MVSLRLTVTKELTFYSPISEAVLRNITRFDHKLAWEAVWKVLF
jgi:hypothetical protein